MLKLPQAVFRLDDSGVEGDFFPLSSPCIPGSILFQLHNISNIFHHIFLWNFGKLQQNCSFAGEFRKQQNSGKIKYFFKNTPKHIPGPL